MMEYLQNYTLWAADYYILSIFVKRERERFSL